MNLLPNEVKLITSNAEKIILTNHRIQMTDSVWGRSITISMFLEDISSIQIKYTSNIFLIILGALCVLMGFLLSGLGIGSLTISGIALGGIFFAIWWFTRRHIVSIASDGGATLNFMVTGMGDEKIDGFVHNILLAKQTRVNQLAKL